MTLLEIAVFYLAVGSPLAADRFFSSRRRRLAFGEAALVLIFWPGFAAYIVYGKVAARLDQREQGHEADQGTDFERIISDASRRIRASTELREGGDALRVQDLIRRYVSMTVASGTSRWGTDGHSRAFAEAAGRTDVEVVARCMNRRNAVRLAEHQGRARRDLLFFLATGVGRSVLPVRDALELARTLGDVETASQIAKLESEPVSEIESTRVKWSTETSTRTDRSEGTPATRARESTIA